MLQDLAPQYALDDEREPHGARPARVAPGKRTLTMGLAPGAPVAPVQMKISYDAPPAAGDDPFWFTRVATEGVAAASVPLPHLAQVQRSFGRHDIGGIQAEVGGAAGSAARAIGAEAYATGNRVGFAQAPDLFTAAHEAAHVVQQRAGVHLKGGVGADGDVYERHADAVAERVVRGESAEALLDEHAGPGESGARAVQRIITGSKALDQHKILAQGFNLFMQSAVATHKGLRLAHLHSNFIVHVTASDDVPQGKAAVTTYGLLSAKGTYVEVGDSLDWTYDHLDDRPVKVYATVTLSSRGGAILDLENAAQVIAHEISGHALSLGPYIDRMLKADQELVEEWEFLATRGALSEDGQHSLMGYGISEAYPHAIAAMCALLREYGMEDSVKKLKGYFGNDIYGQTRDHGPDAGTDKAKPSAGKAADEAELDIEQRMKGLKGVRRSGDSKGIRGEQVEVTADEHPFVINPDETPSDGDCMFNAIIRLGLDGGRNVAQLRQLALDNGGRAQITTAGEWAEGQDIEGLARGLGIRIVTPIYDLGYKAHQTDRYGNAGNTHYIAHIFGGHFVPMRPAKKN
jgi:hypothetical protein